MDQLRRKGNRDGRTFESATQAHSSQAGHASSSTATVTLLLSREKGSLQQFAEKESFRELTRRLAEAGAEADNSPAAGHSLGEVRMLAGVVVGSIPV